MFEGKIDMKKVNMMMGAFVALALTVVVSGCLTRGETYTKTQNTDGSYTESRASIFGTGDKASQVAAEGMFADGTADALGAGFKSANASQTSTGIDGTLAGMGQMFIGMAQLASTFQSMQSGGILPITTATAASSDTAVTPAASTVTTAATKNNTAMASGDGLPEIVILGNKSTCSLCNKLWAALDVPALMAATGASVIDADKTDNPTVYTERRISGAMDWPYVRIYKSGKVVSEFSGRGLTQETLLALACNALGTCADTK